MKKILLLATGGTIASKFTESGLSPQLHCDQLLSYVPSYRSFCTVDAIQILNLDSTNVEPKHWLIMAEAIETHYDAYDGFVICHGTDTMAYSAAALSYLIQDNEKPIVITGAQKPIDLEVTDARTNLLDSLRIACDDRAYGTTIVFGGQVIAGTRAKKDRTKSYNAFSSINYPSLAMIQENQVVYYLDDKKHQKHQVKFYHNLNKNVILLKLVPGISGKFLESLYEHCDAIIIESFGVGGLPNYGGNAFYHAIERFVKNGKIVVMATQVTHEGSDMTVYRVGKMMKDEFCLPESYDMTLEATVAKTMWALCQMKDADDFKNYFYTPINRDLMFVPK